MNNLMVQTRRLAESCRRSDFQAFVYWLTARAIVFASWIAVGVFVPGFGIRDGFFKWDGAWYYSVLIDGYASNPPVGQSNIAFFPGFPLFMRVVDCLPGLSAFRAGVISTLVLGLLATIAFSRLALHVLDEVSASFATAMFALTPGSVVLTMFYSEGLFLLTAILSALFCLQKKWLAAGLMAGLAGFTRPSGVVIVIVVVVCAGLEIRESRRWAPAPAILIAPLGLVAYAVFLHVHVGSVKSYFDAQRLGWGERFSLHERLRDLELLREWVFGGFGASDWNRTIPGIFLLMAIVLLVVMFTRRMPPALPALTIGMLVVVFVSATLGIRPRFFMTAFPLFLAVPIVIKNLHFRFMALVTSGFALGLYSMVTAGTLLQTP